MKKRKDPSGIYHFIVTLPDHLYPFRSQLEGQWVRGIRSYNRALERAFRKHGVGHYGPSLFIYRSVFHVLGSIIVIVLSTLLAQQYFGSERALFFLLALVAVFIAFQEFYLQRKTYRQLWRKGVLDWVSWVAPIGVYLYFFT